jgi:hypothetical protein
VRVFPAWPGRRRKLLPLATQDDSPHAALAAIEARLAETMLPFDVAMLGMGSDDLKNAPRSSLEGEDGGNPLSFAVPVGDNRDEEIDLP